MRSVRPVSDNPAVNGFHNAINTAVYGDHRVFVQRTGGTCAVGIDSVQLTAIGGCVIAVRLAIGPDVVIEEITSDDLPEVSKSSISSAYFACAAETVVI